MSYEGISGLPASALMSVSRARRFYDLEQRDSPNASPLDIELQAQQLARVAIPASEQDLKDLISSYEACIDAYPDLLARTSHAVDRRYAHEAGNSRKEKELDPETGVQIEDPKNVFHFNHFASRRWREQFGGHRTPALFRQFLSSGEELQQSLVGFNYELFSQLEETHPNITKAYFMGTTRYPLNGFGFLRVASYDAYEIEPGSSTAVGKEHKDVSGATLHLFADAPGFCAIVDGQEVEHDTEPGQGFFFLGNGHERLYAPEPRLKALKHKVNRVVAIGRTSMPKRHAIINFINAPFIDYGNSIKDTVPQAAPYRGAA